MSAKKAMNMQNLYDNWIRSLVVAMCCLFVVGCGLDLGSRDPSDSENEPAEDFTVDARCAGNGKPITSQLILGGIVFASETPIAGSCNANNTYQGKYRSMFDDWRASVWIQNNGRWEGWVGGRNANWNDYSYHDTNSKSYIHLCVDKDGHYYCGWGGLWNHSTRVEHIYYGVNEGF